MDPIARTLAREQRAFLRRRDGAWEPHLQRMRDFLGRGLMAADPARPVLILGAGTGLEIPWRLAPPHTTGWDLDPWSRLGTALRHRRWAPWVFADLCGGFEALDRQVAQSGRLGPWARMKPAAARARLAGLLPELNPDPAGLRAWIQRHRPGTILAANVLGQFRPLARRRVEGGLGGTVWEPDPERPDPLAEAVEAWTARAVKAVLEVLGQSGAALWLVHDRALLGEGPRPTLGAFTARWQDQFQGVPWVELEDPLGGLDVPGCLGRAPIEGARWLWPIAEGQTHLMEALAFGPDADHDR